MTTRGLLTKSKAVSSSSLLPKDYNDFKTRQYWDGFFRERGNQAFEWYGTFGDVASLISRHIIGRDSRVMVIGCGNSEFSNELYDMGYQNIRNLDFSPLVIEEMRSKNADGKREKMSWDLGDMTEMKDYEDASFDVVFDKGALDALMSADTLENLEKAQKMFQEISRVLMPNGKYLCVSLAERFILESLVKFFTSDISFSIIVDLVSSNKPSPFKPLFFSFQKNVAVGLTSSSTGEGITNTESQFVLLNIDPFGNSTASPERVPSSELVARVSDIQDFSQRAFDLKEIRIGRFETLELWAATGTGTGMDVQSNHFLLKFLLSDIINVCVFF